MAITVPIEEIEGTKLDISHQGLSGTRVAIVSFSNWVQAVRDLLGTVIAIRGNPVLGKVVTIVNTESYEDAPVGHQIRAGFYRAKLTGSGKDYLIVRTEYHHKGKETNKEPVQQYIPFEKIKRISIMKSERLIHL